MTALFDQPIASTGAEIETRSETTSNKQSLLWTIWDPNLRTVADEWRVPYAEVLAVWHSLLDFAFNNPFERGSIQGLNVALAAHILELPIKRFDRILQG